VVALQQDALVQAMLQYLNDSSLCSQAGQCGRQLVQTKFTWDKVGREMADAFRQILPRERLKL
jgi:glycosyltransferase involved in cell wall biosynthesis